MSLFNLSMNLLEAIGIATITSIPLNKQIRIILIQTFFITLILSLYNDVYLPFVLIILSTLLTSILSFIQNKRVEMPLITQGIFAVLLDCFCLMISLLCVSLMIDIPISILFNNTYNFSLVILLSRFLFLAVASGLHDYQIRFKQDRLLFWLTILFVSLLLLVLGLTNTLIYPDIKPSFMYFIAILFISFVFLLIPILYLMNKNYSDQLKRQKIESIQMSSKNNLMIVEDIASKIEDMEHRVNYVLMSVKHMILANKQEDALKMIEDYAWQLNKISYYVYTGNVYFDQLLAIMIKKMKDKNVSPIIMIDLKKGILNDKTYLVSLYIDILDKLNIYINEDSLLKLSLSSSKNYISFIVSVSNSINVGIEEASFVEEKQLDKNMYFTKRILEDGSLEIRLLEVF